MNLLKKELCLVEPSFPTNEQKIPISCLQQAQNGSSYSLYPLSSTQFLEESQFPTPSSFSLNNITSQNSNQLNQMQLNFQKNNHSHENLQQVSNIQGSLAPQEQIQRQHQDQINIHKKGINNMKYIIPVDTIEQSHSQSYLYGQSQNFQLQNNNYSFSEQQIQRSSSFPLSRNQLTLDAEKKATNFHQIHQNQFFNNPSFLSQSYPDSSNYVKNQQFFGPTFQQSLQSEGNIPELQRNLPPNNYFQNPPHDGAMNLYSDSKKFACLNNITKIKQNFDNSQEQMEKFPNVLQIPSSLKKLEYESMNTHQKLSQQKIADEKPSGKEEKQLMNNSNVGTIPEYIQKIESGVYQISGTNGDQNSMKKNTIQFDQKKSKINSNHLPPELEIKSNCMNEEGPTKFFFFSCGEFQKNSQKGTQIITCEQSSCPKSSQFTGKNRNQQKASFLKQQALQSQENLNYLQAMMKLIKMNHKSCFDILSNMSLKCQFQNFLLSQTQKDIKYLSKGIDEMIIKSTDIQGQAGLIDYMKINLIKASRDNLNLLLNKKNEKIRYNHFFSRYEIVLKEGQEINHLTKGQNFMLEVRIQDIETKQEIDNLFPIPIRLRMYSYANPPVIFDSEFFKGKVDSQIERGTCCFNKIQIKLVSSHQKNKAMFLVVETDIQAYLKQISQEALKVVSIVQNNKESDLRVIEINQESNLTQKINNTQSEVIIKQEYENICDENQSIERNNKNSFSASQNKIGNQELEQLQFKDLGIQQEDKNSKKMVSHKINIALIKPLILEQISVKTKQRTPKNYKV